MCGERKDGASKAEREIIILRVMVLYIAEKILE